MVEFSLEGDLYQEEERTPLGETRAEISQVEGPGSLTVSERGLEWVVGAPGLRRGAEQARDAARFFELKQVGLAQTWPAPSSRQGTCVVVAFERLDWELRARRSMSLRFQNKRSEDFSRLRDALTGPLDSSYWEPDPQTAGWDLWWYPPWINDARRQANLPEPAFVHDEYILWYRAALGLIGSRRLGQRGIEALDTSLHAWRAFVRRSEAGETPDPAPWNEAVAVVEEIRREWMNDHGVAMREEWGFGDWLYTDLLDYLAVYRASLEPGSFGDLARSACRSFHAYAQARAQGTRFEQQQESWKRDYEAWDVGHPAWLRDWYPEREQINSAIKHGRDVGVVWFGPFVPPSELSYWPEADAPVPQDIKALEETPDLFDLETIGVGCVLPIKYRDADLKAELHSHELEHAASLNQRRSFTLNEESYLFASAVLDVSGLFASRLGFRLFINGEWVGYFAKIDWEDDEAWHGYEEPDGAATPKRKILGALRRAQGISADSLAQLDWDDQVEILKDLVSSVYSTADDGDLSQSDEALAAAWEAADALQVGRLKGLVQVLDEVVTDERETDRQAFLEFWKRQFAEITRTLADASDRKELTPQDEAYRVLTLVRHISEMGVLLLRDEGFSDKYFKLMDLAVQSHLNLALKTPPRSPVQTFYLQRNA